jgi:hypothetical protein
MLLAFFVLEVKEATHNCAAYLILEIIELRASLLSATIAKTCRRADKRTEAIVEDGGILMKKKKIKIQTLMDISRKVCLNTVKK